MCLMPESYIASYVGRFAPPGYPNTTSTPSALRHSMIASTARIIACSNLLPPESVIDEASSLTAVGGRFRLYRDFGEVELGAAARADRVVERDDLAAARALAPDLVALGPVEDRGEQSEHRQHAADDEPDEEGRALDLAHDAAREGEGEGEDQVRHCSEVAQRPDHGDQQPDDHHEAEDHRQEADDRADDDLERDDDGRDQDDPRDRLLAEVAEGGRRVLHGEDSLPGVLKRTRRDRRPPRPRGRGGRREESASVVGALDVVE